MLRNSKFFIKNKKFWIQMIDVFAACRRKIPIDTFIKLCAIEKIKDGAFCSSIRLLENECATNDVTLPKWEREFSDCQKSCPETFDFSQNRPNCAKTCSGNIIGDCKEVSDGCHCPESFVLEKNLTTQNYYCLPRSDCKCSHEGLLYSPGEEIHTHCRQCVCNEGEWTCQSEACESTCTVGKHFTFTGTILWRKILSSSFFVRRLKSRSRGLMITKSCAFD